MNRDTPPPLQANERIAEGRGICGQCKGIIEVGERFRWRSGGVPAPICQRCIERRRAEIDLIQKEREERR